MRKRYESKRDKKLKQLSGALERVESCIECDICSPVTCIEDSKWFTGNDQHTPSDTRDTSQFIINWEVIPRCLDPAAGELQELRTKRKRQQVESLVELVETELSHRDSSHPRIVDFGAGSGHLGLLLAYRNPHSEVILLERKEYSVNVALNRIAECGMTNVQVYRNDARDLLVEYSGFDLGVSLHSCGQLTDMALDICVSARASFVITPCCYGQLTKPPPKWDDIDSPSAALDTTVSEPFTSFRSFSSEDPTVFQTIVSGADYCSSFDDTEHAYENAEVTFILAKRCMRVIDFDRAMNVCSQEMEGFYCCRLTSLRPLTCSPKNDVIVGRYCTLP